MRRIHFVLVVCSLLFVNLFAAAESRAEITGPNASNISFTVSMTKPWTHLLEVEMRVQVPANLNVPNETDLVMPVWTPASYLILEFERNVQDFEAIAVNGHRLDWSKVNKNTWRVKTSGVRRWRVGYTVYTTESLRRAN